MTVQELVKNSKNAVITAALEAAGIAVSQVGTIVDIQPTKDKATGLPSTTKSTVYLIATVDGISGGSGSDIKKMSAMERLMQGFGDKPLLRGRITVSNSIIGKMQLAKGKQLPDAVLRVYESFEPFSPGQNPVRRANPDGSFTNTLKQGKVFYRDTKVVTREELASQPHYLIPDLTAAGLVS